jgi:hypothetical protein
MNGRCPVLNCKAVATGCPAGTRACFSRCMRSECSQRRYCNCRLSNWLPIKLTSGAIKKLQANFTNCFYVSLQGENFQNPSNTRMDGRQSRSRVHGEEVSFYTTGNRITISRSFTILTELFRLQVRHFHFRNSLNAIWVTSVGITTGYWLDDRSSIPGSDKKFSLLLSDHTGNGSHPKPPIQFLCPGGKAVGAWSWPPNSI